MKWITREHIKVDRIACPWLITRFVDTDATFLFVPERELMATAPREQATPFDAKGLATVTLDHRGERCTFEAILEDFVLNESPVASTGIDRARRRRQGPRACRPGGCRASRARRWPRGDGSLRPRAPPCGLSDL
jgi:hypothetical protein